MALGSTEITMSLVNQTLGTNYSNLSELCTSDKINIWSKWKPIHAIADTLTYDILKNQNFGISVLTANNITTLYNSVLDNNNIGYTYNPPIGGANSPYRLGDFRNYMHDAQFPMYTTYSDGDTVNTGGVTDTNITKYDRYLEGIESAEGESGQDVLYITNSDIYHYTDLNGVTHELKRGALITDGTNTYWSTEYIPWGYPNWQKFSGDVTVFEFLTNVDNNPDNVYTANTSDRFFALPEPICTITVDNSSVPEGSRLLWAEFDVISFTDVLCGTVDYKFRLSAVGDVYAGGTISNLYCGICADPDGIDIIQNKRLEIGSITIDKEGTSLWYEGTFNNRFNQETESYPSLIYFCIWYNNTLQHTTMPMQEAPEEQNEE